MGLKEDRLAKGQCPTCGKEAAPYRLCYDCRQGLRFNRAIRRGQRLGVFKYMAGATSLRKDTLIFLGDKNKDPEVRRELNKWATPWVLPESDLRGKPKLKGIRIDVEKTLVGVVEYIGRPCTIDEIMLAWGKLRAKRSDPLPNDLARIIQAEEKRKRKALKLAKIKPRQSGNAMRSE